MNIGRLKQWEPVSSSTHKSLPFIVDLNYPVFSKAAAQAERLCVQPNGLELQSQQDRLTSVGKNMCGFDKSRI